MMAKLVTRTTVMRRYCVDAQLLDRLEELQVLVPVRRPGKPKAYLEQDLDFIRVWKVLTEELEVGPAGAEIILRMRKRLLMLHQTLETLLRALEDDELLERLREHLQLRG